MITKEDFVNKICQAANELIARAKLENPRRMKDLSATIPICSSCFVDIDVEYEINDDGDICETEFTLTEKQLTELAKAVDKILFNIR